MKQLMLIFWSIIFITNSCHEDGHETIVFENNSDLRLYVAGNSITYPDTSIIFGDLTKTGTSLIVSPNSVDSGILALHRESYEEKLDHPTQDTLMVFVFDAYVVESTSWETVKENYLVLKRYDLSLDDLIDLNWKITYP